MDSVILGIDPGTNIMGYGVLAVDRHGVSMVDTGVWDFRKIDSAYEKLGAIQKNITSIVNRHKPDSMAIESPFMGKNIQSMLKLGRAQGVAIASAVNAGLEIYEYTPLKIKMAITGQGLASKEQVADMIRRILKIKEEEMPGYYDASDAIAVAYCHYLQAGKVPSQVKYKSWKDYIVKNNLSKL